MSPSQVPHIPVSLILAKCQVSIYSEPPFSCPVSGGRISISHHSRHTADGCKATCAAADISTTAAQAAAPPGSTTKTDCSISGRRVRVRVTRCAGRAALAHMSTPPHCTTRWAPLYSIFTYTHFKHRVLLQDESNIRVPSDGDRMKLFPFIKGLKYI